MIRWTILGVLLLPGLGACLTDPELAECSEFPLGAEQGGCDKPECDVYCDGMTETCPETFGSRDVCISQCDLEQVVQPPPVLGTFGDRQGNSYECRMTYLREGDCTQASLEQTTACTGVAGVSCTEYCSTMMTHCPAAYPSNRNCTDSCEALPRAADDADQNSIECRFKYAQLASQQTSDVDKIPLCDQAGFSSDGTCGDPCETYCDFVDDNCSEPPNVIYPDGNCRQICDQMNKDGGHDDWQFAIELDTVQCRAYHAGPPAVAQPEVHCPHARLYNVAHCGIDPALGGSQPADWPCTSFCDVILRNCQGSFADEMTCLQECSSFPELIGFDESNPGLYPFTPAVCP